MSEEGGKEIGGEGEGVYIFIGLRLGLDCIKETSTFPTSKHPPTHSTLHALTAQRTIANPHI